MRILDEQDQEMQLEDCDLTLGYLTADKHFVKHHEAQEAVAEQGHYYPQTFYFMDGTKYNVTVEGENDPCVQPNEDGVSFTYIAPEGEEPREYKGCDVKYIIDVEHQDAKEAYDEMEDIQRYKLYTKEQLEENRKNREEAEKREKFMTTGPDRLDTAEIDITGLTTSMDDITMLMADMIGVG